MDNEKNLIDNESNQLDDNNLICNKRNKAWRQAKRKTKEKSTKDMKAGFKPEKNWKLQYTRSEKLQRAKQLGIDYPAKTLRQRLDDEMPIKDE